ncbi:protein distal antenna-like [Toxorhynchites rutilus septentrionalis]|uniref:protein distal antenna-like n=1 Tax=Toxorhynchites rutilus septentrionalis TaxID=329112 RepID=UPI00247A3856|nr:protein distal antenna-like [Toxorhynchites rutilus septentrionalis]XP_055616282.1 protein distal antenna-like [Toxorhynchites rutilus septentrionalis]XP_055616283.1 protein distal antenna-like [Toxorhynchites rutilus septentrionalis]
METKSKRYLRHFAPSEKFDAIQRVRNGETKASVARDIGVPESTLRGWCNKEEKIRYVVTSSQAERFNEPARKRVKLDQIVPENDNSSLDNLSHNQLTAIYSELYLNLYLIAQLQNNHNGAAMFGHAIDRSPIAPCSELDNHDQAGFESHNVHSSDNMEDYRHFRPCSSSSSVDSDLKPNHGGEEQPKEPKPDDAVEHDEKLLEWMKLFAHPDVTSTQMMQLKCLISETQLGTEQKQLEQPDVTSTEEEAIGARRSRKQMRPFRRCQPATNTSAFLEVPSVPESDTAGGDSKDM